MMRERVLSAPPLVEQPIGAAGHLLAWQKNEAGGTR
jgi:hypothetical protein